MAGNACMEFLFTVLHRLFFSSRWLIFHMLKQWIAVREDESCQNDYHQSLERKLAELGIEPLICSQLLCTTNRAMQACFMIDRSKVYIHQPFSRTFLVFFSKSCKLECNANSDWLNHTV